MNKKIKLILGIVALLCLGIASYIYINYFTDNTNFAKNEFYLEIPTGSKYEDVKKIISPYIQNYSSFEFIANRRHYPENVKSGRFLFKKGMGSFALVSTLRQNVPVNLAFNNQERLENVAQRIGSQIEPDSLQLIKVFRDSIFLKENGFNEENVLAMFIPNTYQIYWNISAEKFRDKMIAEFHKFWTKERITLAQKNNLTPIQATILASIVHKESVKKDERPRIAAVYLNRLKIAMPLQADPTVIYAVKKHSGNFDSIIKRVLYEDLKLDSPYNTYLYTGLPPGPVAMPDITALEAVLKPEKNDYLFFCASVTHFGYHEFASTLAQHDVNRKKYVDWISNQGVKR